MRGGRAGRPAHRRPGNGRREDADTRLLRRAVERPLVAGALLLFNSPLYRLSIAAVVTVAAVTGLFFAFAVTKAFQAQRRPAVTGGEGLVGQLGHTKTPLDPQGTVLVKGELWEAVAENGPIGQDETVKIVAVDGFLLHVVKASEV